MKKFNLFYSFLTLLLICFSCYAKPVATYGWYQNAWINNVFTPAGIEVESLSAWVPPDSWDNYSMVVITQDSAIPKLEEAENKKVYSYLERGGILVLTGAVPGYLGEGPGGILDISSIEPWFGAKHYGYGSKTPFIAVDDNHPIVSHLEVGREYDWNGIDPRIRIGKLTTGKLLVGTEQGAAIFVNKVGEGQCIYLVGNPIDIDNPQYEENYATVVSAIAKFIAKKTDDEPEMQVEESKIEEIKGDPNLPIDPPQNLIAEAYLPRLIKLTWQTPGGGKSSRRASMYLVMRSVSPHFPDGLTQEFLVRPTTRLSPANETFEWIDVEVEAGIIYYYKVIAYDEFYHESKPSNVVEMFLPILPE